MTLPGLLHHEVLNELSRQEMDRLNMAVQDENSKIPQVVRNSIDLQALVAAADKAGFNPLTVVRNGGLAGFGVTEGPRLAKQALFTSSAFTATVMPQTATVEPMLEPEAKPEEQPVPVIENPITAETKKQSWSPQPQRSINDSKVLHDEWSVGGEGSNFWDENGPGGLTTSTERKALQEAATQQAYQRNIVAQPAPSRMFRTPTAPAAAGKFTKGAPATGGGNIHWSGQPYREMGIGFGLTWESLPTWSMGQDIEDEMGEIGSTPFQVAKTAIEVGHNLRRAANWGLPRAASAVNGWVSSGFGGLFAPGWGGLTGPSTPTITYRSPRPGESGHVSRDGGLTWSSQ